MQEFDAARCSYVRTSFACTVCIVERGTIAGSKERKRVGWWPLGEPHGLVIPDVSLTACIDEANHTRRGSIPVVL